MTLLRARETRRDTVVVVDGSATMRRLLLRELRHCGVDAARIVEAGDADSARAAVDGDQVAVAFVDDSLPGMSGRQLISGLRSEDRTTRWVLVSADWSAQSLRSAAAAGATGLLPKPFATEDVRRALDGTLPGPAEVLALCRPGALELPQLPAPPQVESCLGTLLGRAVMVEDGHPVLARPGQPAAVAAYVDSRLRTAAVLAADAALASALVGALGLEPEPLAAGGPRPVRLPARDVKALREIAEVAMGLFVPPGGSALRLFAVHPPGELPSRPTAQASAALRLRLDLHVEVPGYGSGGLSLVVPR